MTPKTQKALFVVSEGGSFAVQTTTVPSPGPGEILAKVEATGLNPVDWKIKFLYHEWINWIQYPAILGIDGAGVVDAVGEGVSNLKIGDPILWQGVHGNERTTFQQYALVTAELAAKIPSNMSVDEAASIPLTLGTAFLGMYNKKKDGPGGGAGLTPFWKSTTAYAGQPFVVLGGATSTGQFAIQLARLSGFSPIIVTASEKHVEHLKSLGATHVLPRSLSDDGLAAEISKVTPQPLKLVFDTVSIAETQKTGLSLVVPGGQLILVLPPIEGVVHGRDGKELVRTTGNVNFTGQGEVGRELYARLTQLLQDGWIKPLRIQVVPGGLAGIPDGLELLRLDKVGGIRLIAHPQETA
ncbi:GroES-like protein [Punctularia strigosozonata HHB-11173 SS5]|uniref:GroES-like protein n=1 Tax=Punctularia strigosozonata (strain HHB-11173) TaxID=741275 RepID=UPI0004417838|nr:GroES-like protein [Punctularia strigosozonata HHB-11173 SS5]EIN12454.1 GroES-like protein [Punctularia strigosozonata HHB-11173 SS5]